MKTIPEAAKDGPFIQTMDGPFNYFHNTCTSGITGEGLAASLASTARFRGLTDVFYSVAWHSVFGAMLCEEMTPQEWESISMAPHLIPKDQGQRTLAALHFLLHDAAEAYLGDIPTPLKRCLWVQDPREEAKWEGIAALPEVRSVSNLELDILERIYDHLGMPKRLRPTPKQRAFTKTVDNLMFQWEVQWLYGMDHLLEVMESGYGAGTEDTEAIYVSVRCVSRVLDSRIIKLYSSTVHPADLGRSAWIRRLTQLMSATDTSLTHD